jgi:EAL domain-containing protein (putative c-di-GMP-specific phosphodiesterase class I)/GGDEF domain-containing protein
MSPAPAAPPAPPESTLRPYLARGAWALVLTVLLCVIDRAVNGEMPEPWPLWPATAVGLAFAWRLGLLWLLPALLGALIFAWPLASSSIDLLALLTGAALGPIVGVRAHQRLELWHPAQSALQSAQRFIGLVLGVVVPITLLFSLVAGLFMPGASFRQRVSDFPLGLSALDMWLSGGLFLLILTPAALALLEVRSARANKQGDQEDASERWFDVTVVGSAFVLSLLILSLTAFSHHAFAGVLLHGAIPVLMWSALRNNARSHALTVFLSILPIVAVTVQLGHHQWPDHLMDTLWFEAQAGALLLCAVTIAMLTQAVAADRAQALTRTARQGREDVRTGLLNDRGLMTDLGEMLGRPDRPPMGIISVQLGNLAAIQELCGPLEVSRLESRVTASLLQAADSVALDASHTLLAARWSEERFILAATASTVSEVRQIAREVYVRLSGDAYAGEHDRLSLQVSVGGLLVEAAIPLQPEECMAALDDAQTIASSVRDPQLFVEPLSQSMLASRRQQHDRTEQLRDAIREGRLELYAQAVVDPDAPSGTQSYEILTRLRDRDGDIIQPPEFMPLALKAQLLSKLDRAVIHRTFEWLAVNPQALARTYKCSINLSGASLDDPGLPAYVREMRLAHDIPAQRIVFEITEGEAIRHAAAASRLVDELKAEGFGIALDDFGTGLATFEYLKRFPLDYLKIDGSFIRNLTQDGLDEEIVISTLRVAEKLKLRAVAEHVQTEEVRKRLLELGVRYLQGDLFGRAAPIGSLFEADAPVRIQDHFHRASEAVASSAAQRAR